MSELSGSITLELSTKKPLDQSTNQNPIDCSYNTQTIKEYNNVLIKGRKHSYISKIAPSDMNHILTNRNRKLFTISGKNKNTKPIPMTYSESQRMIQLEFNPTNSNVTCQKIFYRLSIENIIYLLDMENSLNIDDHVNTLSSIFTVDSSDESIAPIPIWNGGPRVLGGGILNMNNGCKSLLQLRQLKFPLSTIDNHKDVCVEGKFNVNSNKLTNGIKDSGIKGQPMKRIGRPFTIKESKTFKFDNNNNRTSTHGMSLMKIVNNNKKKYTTINNDDNNATIELPKPSYNINKSIDNILKKISTKSLTPPNNATTLDEPVYFAEKYKLTNQSSYYAYNQEEQKRYHDDLHYDMDEDDLAFLLITNIKRVIDWNRQGNSFFVDDITERKLDNATHGLDPISWNYFVENLMIPSITAESLPQNCTDDVTTLLVNGITFESIIDKLERNSKYESRNIHGEIVKPNINPQETYCEICSDDECSVGNVIVYCDVCNIGVHQECYGIPYIPDDAWVCQRCIASPSCTNTCCLCPNNFGVMKQTNQQKWCHMVCALWITDVTFSNNVFLEPIDITSVSNDRFKLVCYICGIRTGACIQCMNISCYIAMHVSCAQLAGLLVFQITKKLDHNDNVLDIQPKFKCYCEAHLHKATNNHSTSYTVYDEKKCVETRFIISKPRKNNITNNTSKNDTDSNKDNCYQPIIQVSCVSNDQLDNISQQLPLYKSDQLVRDIYQYWLVRRFMRGGAPLIRGISTTSKHVATSSSFNNNISINETHDNIGDNSNQNIIISKYDQLYSCYNSTKTIHNLLTVIDFLLCFETIIFTILNMFIDLITVNVSNYQLAIKTHNIRAYMIRNLATLDPKCPSYLKNIIYPLHLYDQLHNFSMNYLEKLYEISSLQQHIITKQKYNKILMTIRIAIQQRFPLGKYKFSFVNMFKDQIRFKNYTMSHDIQEEHIDTDEPIKLLNKGNNQIDIESINDDKTNSNTNNIDVNIVNEAEEIIANVSRDTNQINNDTNTTKTPDIIQLNRKPRKGIPEKAPKRYNDNIVFESTHNTEIINNGKPKDSMKNPSDMIKNKNEETKLKPSKRDKPKKSVDNNNSSNTVKSNETTINITTSSSKNAIDKKTAGRPNAKHSRSHKQTTLLAHPKKRSVSLNNKSITKFRHNTRNSFIENSPIRTRRHTNLMNSNTSLRKKSKTQNSAQYPNTTNGKIIRNNNKSTIQNYFNDKPDIIEINSKRVQKRSNKTAELNTLTEIAHKSRKLLDTHKNKITTTTTTTTTTDKNNSKPRIYTKNINPLESFQFVDGCEIYFTISSPYVAISNPKKDPLYLDEYTLVWAKLAGYSPYPAIVVTSKSSIKILSKFNITKENFRKILHFIDKKGIGTCTKSKKNPVNQSSYVVVFLDETRTFQILHRESLEPLGVDRELDKRRINGFYSKKTSTKIKTSFVNGYNFAINMLKNMSKLKI